MHISSTGYPQLTNKLSTGEDLTQRLGGGKVVLYRRCLSTGFAMPTTSANFD